MTRAISPCGSTLIMLSRSSMLVLLDQMVISFQTKSLMRSMLRPASIRSRARPCVLP